MLMLLVGKLLFTLTLMLPPFSWLRTTRMARPFQVVTRGEVYGS